jgi:hypothetical protein
MKPFPPDPMLLGSSLQAMKRLLAPTPKRRIWWPWRFRWRRKKAEVVEIQTRRAG